MAKERYDACRTKEMTSQLRHAEVQQLLSNASIDGQGDHRKNLEVARRLLDPTTNRAAKLAFCLSAEGPGAKFMEEWPALSQEWGNVLALAGTVIPLERLQPESVVRTFKGFFDAGLAATQIQHVLLRSLYTEYCKVSVDTTFQPCFEDFLRVRIGQETKHDVPARLLDAKLSEDSLRLAQQLWKHWGTFKKNLGQEAGSLKWLSEAALKAEDELKDRRKHQEKADSDRKVQEKKEKKEKEQREETEQPQQKEEEDKKQEPCHDDAECGGQGAAEMLQGAEVKMHFQKGKDKASCDGFRGQIVKVAADHCQVLLLEGPARGERKRIPRKSLTLQPAGAASSSGTKRDRSERKEPGKEGRPAKGASMQAELQKIFGDLSKVG